MILKPDDFDIGIYVTVLDNSPYKREIESFEPETFGGVKTLVNEDRSGMGSVLEIIAINLPYIVCKHHDKYKHSVYNSSYDTRRTRFISLNTDYVKLILEVKK